jgi:hypothetical protein
LRLAWTFSGLSAAAEFPISSLLKGYGLTADQFLKAIKTQTVDAKPEPTRFPMALEKPSVNFRLADNPKPEITGNPSIDNLNTWQLEECLRTFRGNSIACGQHPEEQPAK